MADIKNIINELLLELSVTYPFPNMKDREQVFALLDICEELGYDYLKPQLEEMFLNEAEEEGESKLFPGKFHLGGGFYSSKNGGEAELKNEKGNLRPVTPEEKAKFDAKNGKGEQPQPTDEPKKDEPTAEKPVDKPEEPTAEKPSAEQPEQPAPPQQNPEIEQGKKDAKEDPQKVLSDPKATAQSKAMARAFKAQSDVEDSAKEDEGKSEPAKLEPINDDPTSKAKKFKGKKSGKEIQTIEMDGGGMVFGTVHRNRKMVDDIIDHVKATIPEERWKDIVFVGEGGATNDKGQLEFHDEMKYAAPKFKEFGAGVDTFDGDDLDVHNDQSKLYKRQKEKTGLNDTQVKAGNWASMIGQGEGTDTMSPNDYLDDEGKQFLQDAAKEAGLPPIEDFDNPKGEVPSAENPEGSGDIGTLYRLSFPEDNGDTETKVNDIQVAFNEIRDENLIEKNKELVAQGKIPITIAGEGHIELVDNMLKKGGDKKSETKAVEPEKIADEMPEADKETFAKDGKALDGIEPQQLEQFNTDISKVSKMIDDAKAKGEPAPNINLCDITIPGTNLYCDDNQGIPREEMPQFKGKAVEGSRAAGMETDKDGEVDTEPVFREMLKEKGVKVLQTEVPADKLKATQKDLVGEKVIGMMGALEKDPTHPKITAPIYVSRDGYVIDGHHRWAAIVAHNAKHPDNPIPMKTTVIDMDIKDAIPMANKFAEDMGIAAKKADAKDGEAPTEEPKVTDDKIGAKATTNGGKKLYHIGNGYYSDSPNGDAKYIRVESVVERAIETDNRKWWNLLFEQNIEATVEDGEEGVFKQIPNDEVEVATDAAKQDANKSAGDTKNTNPTKSKKKGSKPKVSPEEAEALKRDFSRKTEATEGLTHSEYKKLPNGTEVRQLVDENGDIIDVSTPEGRKKAVEVLDKRIQSLSEKTQTAIRNFDVGLVQVQKWLGEIGEITALKQILEQDVEAYLLTDSERKNDIAFVKPNGEDTQLSTGFISVKTTKGDGGVNKRGANCKADLDKLVKTGDEEYEVNGLKLKPTNVLGSIVDVKSGLFKQFTSKSSGETTEKVIVDGKQQKLTRYDKAKHPNVDEKDIVKDSKGNFYFKSQAAFLRNKELTEKDVEDFFDNPENDKYFTNLGKPSKGNPNNIADEEELKNTKEYIRGILLDRIKNWKELNNGKPFTLADLHQVMFEIVGAVIEDANIKVGATGDTMAVHFTEGNPEPQIGVIKKEDANGPVQQAYEEVSQVKDERLRRIGLASRCLGMSSRTRAIGSDLHYDGIDNMEPVGDLDSSVEVPLAEYVKQ